MNNRGFVHERINTESHRDLRVFDGEQSNARILYRRTKAVL